MFERIVDLSVGSPPEEIKADFKRVDFESSKVLCDIRDHVREFHKQERLDKSQTHERDVF